MWTIRLLIVGVVGLWMVVSAFLNAVHVPQAATPAAPDYLADVSGRPVPLWPTELHE